MNERLLPLAHRIRDELGELEYLIQRAQEGWRRAEQSSDEYRGFRHLVRNVYTFQLDPAKVGRLVQHAPAVLGQMSRELLAFADFLEQRGRGDG